MKKDIRNHPYHLEQALQRQNGTIRNSNPSPFIANPSTTLERPNSPLVNGLLPTSHDQQQQQKAITKSTTYFTWLVFMYAKWVPFDASNQGKLEQTLHLGGTFVDIEDSNFPKVKRVRVFPKSNYLSYLGVKYRLSRVMQPDVWSDSHETVSTTVPSPTQQQHRLSAPLPSPLSSSQPNEMEHTLTRLLPPPPPLSPNTTTFSFSSTSSTSSSSSLYSSSPSSTTLDYWRSNPHRSSQTLISHVLS
ncbi:hypothetical protein [Absidia glauca]|uniref:Uncharacterized protein n=1 Tax=Absidia glauca TaxID=4829 RepID=A0A168RUY5_ABSGL|nr:hypothetical protein [Absidia glauca]